MKIDLTIEQYLLVIKHELIERLSRRCGVRINKDLLSITIIWDNWNFTTTELKTLYDNGYPIEECVRLIVVQAQDEFAKILLSSEEGKT